MVVGLAARFALAGGLADAAGGVFYTALVYVLIALVWPRLEPVRVGCAAFAFSAAIEGLQWTGLAADLVDVWSPLRLVVGTSFVATDLLAYALGAAIAAFADTRLMAGAASSGSRRAAR